MNKIVSVEPFAEYTPSWKNSTYETTIKNMKNYLNKGVFKKLKDKNFFNSVHISFDTISWDDEIDICPDTLYETSIPLE